MCRPPVVGMCELCLERDLLSVDLLVYSWICRECVSFPRGLLTIHPESVEIVSFPRGFLRIHPESVEIVFLLFPGVFWGYILHSGLSLCLNRHRLAAAHSSGWALSCWRCSSIITWDLFQWMRNCTSSRNWSVVRSSVLCISETCVRKAWYRNLML